MHGWQIGDSKIIRVVETEDTSMPAEALVPDAKAENVLPIKWLQPHFITPEGELISSVFALLVESCGKRIVIDTCLGNDKERIVPQWNMRQGDFLEQIAAAGFDRESVDYVVCTHLHPDHVGWNTMLVDGEWQPTFPNARYLFTQADWDWLDNAKVSALGDYAGDSVRPIFANNLADLYTPDYQLNDEVTLVSMPGHSPGHIGVSIKSNGQSAFITGDVIHHPCQLAHPEWRSPFDFDGDKAQDTREGFLKDYVNSGTLVIGSHFATPSAGYVVADGNSYRLDTSNKD